MDEYWILNSQLNFFIRNHYIAISVSELHQLAFNEGDHLQIPPVLELGFCKTNKTKQLVLGTV